MKIILELYVYMNNLIFNYKIFNKFNYILNILEIKNYIINIKINIFYINIKKNYKIIKKNLNKFFY